MNSGNSFSGSAQGSMGQGAVITPTGPTMKPGGFWIRFVASFIDSMIVNIVTFPLSFILGLIIGFAGSADGRSGSGVEALGGLAGGILGGAVAFVYYGWFYSKKGATPGKMLFKLKVVDAKTGTYISFGRAFLRDVVGKFISAILLLIGFIMAGFRKDKRALHDFIAGTQVLRSE